MSSIPPLYRLHNIQHYYGEKQILDIPSFIIEKGDIVGLLGPNGSGKTTLLKLLAFAQAPTHGDLFYNQQIERPFSKQIRSRVTLLTQKPYLLKRSVYDNIAYGLKLRKETRGITDRISEVLSLVGLEFDQFAHRMWHELSGGEAQRVALAARLILKPETLLLDEPVASVDVASAQLIREAAMKARDQWQTTLVIASHDLSWLFSVSDKQVSIVGGKLYRTGEKALIPGPFFKAGHNHLKRYVTEDQSLYLKAPEKKETTALVPKDAIQISAGDPDISSKSNCVTALVVSMYLEKKHRTVMVGIAIDDFQIELGLSFDKVRDLGLTPGQEIELRFSPDTVEWL